MAGAANSDAKSLWNSFDSTISLSHPLYLFLVRVANLPFRHSLPLLSSLSSAVLSPSLASLAWLLSDRN